MKLYINGEEVANAKNISIEAVENPGDYQTEVSVVIDGNKQEEQIHIADDSFELRLTK